MSGGSYNYLFLADDIYDMIGKKQNLRNMIADMSADGEEAGADLLRQLFKDVESVDRILKRLESEMQEKWKKLMPLMKAYEWYVSNDWGFDEVEGAVKEITEGD